MPQEEHRLWLRCYETITIFPSRIFHRRCVFMTALQPREDTHWDIRSANGVSTGVVRGSMGSRGELAFSSSSMFRVAQLAGSKQGTITIVTRF